MHSSNRSRDIEIQVYKNKFATIEQLENIMKLIRSLNNFQNACNFLEISKNLQAVSCNCATTKHWETRVGRGSNVIKLFIVWVLHTFGIFQILENFPWELFKMPLISSSFAQLLNLPIAIAQLGIHEDLYMVGHLKYLNFIFYRVINTWFPNVWKLSLRTLQNAFDFL